jgi:hypothetical protein
MFARVRQRRALLSSSAHRRCVPPPGLPQRRPAGGDAVRENAVSSATLRAAFRPPVRVAHSGCQPDGPAPVDGLAARFSGARAASASRSSPTSRLTASSTSSPAAQPRLHMRQPGRDLAGRHSGVDVADQDHHVELQSSSSRWHHRGRLFPIAPPPPSRERRTGRRGRRPHGSVTLRGMETAGGSVRDTTRRGAARRPPLRWYRRTSGCRWDADLAASGSNGSLPVHAQRLRRRLHITHARQSIVVGSSDTRDRPPDKIRYGRA